MRWEHTLLLASKVPPASRVEAARFVDAKARMDNFTGYNIDAIQAFNQIPLPSECLPLWVSLPRHRWPKEWEGKGYRNPVVLQIYNLYGYPRAGHYWEQHVENCARKEGWKSLPGWEYLYVSQLIVLS